MRPSTDTLTLMVEVSLRPLTFLISQGRDLTSHPQPLLLSLQNSHGLLVRKREVYVPSSIFQDDFVIPDISE